MAEDARAAGGPGPSGEGAARAEALTRLWAAMARELPGQRPIVPGEGSPLARLALVGEAPGREEERLGRPFVGPAGRLLDALLAEVGLSRADVWVTNVFKRRPVALRDGREENRAPTAAELRAGLRWLLQELGIVRPRLVVCLGAVALRALLGRGTTLGEARGRWQPGPLGTLVLATYHPAYVLRLQGTPYQRAFQEALGEVRQDFQRVREAYEQEEAA